MNPIWKRTHRNFTSSKSILHVIDNEYRKQRLRPCSCKNSCITSTTPLVDSKRANCPCVRNLQECIPNLCSCFCRINPSDPLLSKELPLCQNSSCWYLVDCTTLIKPTRICLGMGLFADKFYPKNSYLGFYGGEYTFANSVFI